MAALSKVHSDKERREAVGNHKPGYQVQRECDDHVADKNTNVIMPLSCVSVRISCASLKGIFVQWRSHLCINIF